MLDEGAFNYYHVDPRTTRGDTSGRYPENFVKFPWFLKPLNWGDALSRAVMGRPAYLLEDRLLKVFDAVETPLERWGSAEEIGILRQNLARLSIGLDRNPYISPVGRVLIKTMAKAHLENRAATITFYETNRKFIEANGRFKTPLLVTGLFRTGTTLLHRLISEDPNTRAPYLYELERSTPPLQAGMDPMQDPRIEKSAAATAIFSKFMPGLIEKASESHLWSPVEKEESLVYVQAHNGMGINIGVTAGRPQIRGMHEHSAAAALLKYERNLFTMLDAYCPARSRWTLKSPAYAPYFGNIFEHYPDAYVIVNHRHPSKNIASVCRMFESFTLPFAREGSFDKLRLGAIIQEEFGMFLSRPLEFRQTNPQYESQIIDCMYQDLMRDPIGMVKGIYAKFNLEYTPEFEERMRRYLADNRQGKHGRHKYTNAEYGIDPHVLYERNKTYFDHYGFKPQPGNAD